MKAVILAAGRGSRMKSMTADRPKCLVELSGHPLISLQKAALRAGGVDQIGLVRGYLGDRFEEFELTLFDNPRWQETNMVASLAAAAEWLRAEPCIVSYADIFFPASTVSQLSDATGDLAIAYDPDWLSQWSARFADPLTDAESFRIASDGRVTEIGQRAASVDDIEGQYMGLLRFTPRSWRAIEAILSEAGPDAIDTFDMTTLLAKFIAEGNVVQGVPTAPGWGEIDSEADLAYFEGEVSSGRIRLPV